MFAPLVLLLALPAADAREAETLFRQMETRLLKAKAIELTYEMQSDAEKNFTMKGTFQAEGNKFRLEITSDLEGFWRDSYPKIKKELQRKYPKHEWR